MIDWQPGQAALMEQYLMKSMQKPASDDDINVQVNMMPVLIPIAIKKSIGYVVLYTLATAIVTKLLWK